ncbi:MAG TPA: hypothetical protein VNG71_17270 [Pyrinomonadaceae bacterium]|nr:hypothetical protein [Pyrinomonadaceae bacterium]
MNKENNSDKLMNWLLGQVVIPVLFVGVAMGVIGYFHRSLTATLADGELLLVGTVLSLAVTGEMIFSDTKSKKLMALSLLLCVVFAIFYVFFKSRLASYDLSPGAPMPEEFHACALFSFGLGAIAIAWSIFGYLLFTRKLIQTSGDSQTK